MSNLEVDADSTPDCPGPTLATASGVYGNYRLRIILLRCSVLMNCTHTGRQHRATSD